MSRRNASLIILAIASLLSLATCGGAAAQPRTSAATTVTIRPFPDGIYGYVTSPAAKACATNRKVEVFEQRGAEPDPGTDPRVGSGRAAELGGALYQWSVRTHGSGQFYARAPARRGCEAALSGVTTAQSFAASGDPGEPNYPPCSPYVAEGTTEICDLGLLNFEMQEESFLSSCSFGAADGNCPGHGAGIFPWGTTADGSRRAGARLYWTPRSGAERNVSIVSFQGAESEGEGAAFLSGTMSSSGSDSFNVTDAWAQNELGGNYGQHFKTLSLPGRNPGEVGAPLKINCVYVSSERLLQCLVNGYLYLKG